MEVTSHLLSLYETILVPILSGWIEIIDLCYFDTSVCNKNFRNRFLLHLEKCRCTNDSSKPYNADSIDWMCIRGISLTNLDLKDLSNPQKMLLFEKSQHLSELTVSSHSTHFDYLVERKLSADTLRIQSINRVTDIELVIGNAQCLVHLDVSSCMLSQESLSIIVSSYPDLKVLSLPGILSVLPVVESCCLEQISCNLATTLKPGLRSTANRCTLRRTLSPNSSSIRIADKFYNMVSLSVQLTSLTVDDEVEVYIPYVASLTDFTLRSVMTPLLSAVAAKCFSLVSLTVSNVKVDEDVLVTLVLHSKQLVKVEFTALSSLTDKTVNTLAAACPLLKSCTALSMTITTTALVHLMSNCSSLTFLSSGSLGMSPATLIHAGTNKDILEVWGVGFSCILKIDNIRNFNRITYEYSQQISHKAFELLFQQNTALQKVVFTFLDSLDDYVIECLVHLCPLLANVTILDCHYITSAVLVHLARAKELINLHLFGVHNISDALVEKLLQNRSGFVRLALNKCTGISKEILSYIATHCPAIKHITLSNSLPVNDKNVLDLLDACTQLRYLNVTGCPETTEEIFKHPRAKQVTIIV